MPYAGTSQWNAPVINGTEGRKTGTFQMQMYSEKTGRSTRTTLHRKTWGQVRHGSTTVLPCGHARLKTLGQQHSWEMELNPNPNNIQGLVYIWKFTFHSKIISIFIPLKGFLPVETLLFNESKWNIQNENEVLLKFRSQQSHESKTPWNLLALSSFRIN